MRYTKGQGISEGIPSTPSQRKPMLKKSFWSRQEDEKLINYIQKNGKLGSWSYVAKHAGLHRCGKSCRLRWINYLRPGLKRGSFSYQEERLIIRLQSIFGNRWSLIAAELPGRTDNELKNYWNTCIKKKLKLKHHLSSSSSKSNVIDTKSHIPTQYNSNSVSVHAHDVFTSSHSFQQCMDVLPEGSQPPNNALNAVNNGENLLCVPGIMELKHTQIQDQSDHEFSIDLNPTNNHQVSYPNLWTNASSINNIHESFCSPTAFISPSRHAKSSTCNTQLIIESCSSSTTVALHEAPCFPEIFPGSAGINIPALVESESSQGKFENDENHITIDYSNATDSSDIVDPGAYTNHQEKVSILEKYGNLYENNTQQSYPPLNLYSQFSWPSSEVSEILSYEHCRDSLNWSYDVNLGVPTYVQYQSSRPL